MEKYYSMSKITILDLVESWLTAISHGGQRLALVYAVDRYFGSSRPQISLIRHPAAFPAMSPLLTSDLLLALLGLFIPPFPVMVKTGVCSAHTLINIVLSILGGVPGVIHCWYIIISHPDDGIPFLNSPQGNYALVPDAEAQAGSSGRSEGSVSPGGPALSSQAPAQSAQQYADEPGSSNAGPPPAYGAIVGDNKVQYNG
uniref:ARAD1D01540p n=1 Tax=Blastobotrys adeninivorans TaxID=409370 RepID=A0A060T7Q8_BLAAD